MSAKCFSVTVTLVFFVLFQCSFLNGEVRYGESVTIAADEVIDDDLYIFAQTIVIDGTVKGDVIASGQQLWINGVVEGDLNAAGQQIVINGKVMDDTRIAGQMLTVSQSANVVDDLVAAGFNLTSEANSTIGGETYFAGYQTELSGNYEQAVSLSVAHCNLAGNFSDDVEATVDGSSAYRPGPWGDDSSGFNGLTVASSAKIAGDLNYRSPTDAMINPDAAIEGEVDFTKTEAATSQPATISGRSVSFAKNYFGLLLVGLIVIFACPKWTGSVVNNIQQRPIATIAWGVLAFIGCITALVLLVVTVICIAVMLGVVSLDNLLPAWLGMGLLTIGSSIVGFIFFLSWITKVIVSAWAGNRIINGERWNAKSGLYSLALGVLIYCLLSILPFVGTAFSFAATLIGLGGASVCFVSKSEPPIVEKPVTTVEDLSEEASLNEQREVQCA